MKKKILAFLVLFTALLTACEQGSKTKDDAIIHAQSMNENGNVLDMTFDNDKETVKVRLDNEEAIELNIAVSGSGYRYVKDGYELRGKGNDVTFTKDEKVLFEHQDDFVLIEVSDDKNNTLNLTFNNNNGTVKVYLNGGDQIDLKQEVSASGEWYKNEHYSLSGKGKKYKLKKDDVVLFSNF